MGWDKTIPNENNVVRGVSGDLAKVRENFEALDPIVVSGLHGLPGVDAASPASGDVLRHDGSGWANAQDTLSGLVDTDVAGAVSGDALTYNDATKKWEPNTPVQSLSGLTDTDVAGAASGDALTYNSATGKWEPATPVAALNDLTDVDTSGAVSGQALVFDGSGWGPGASVSSGLSRAMLVLGSDQAVVSVSGAPYTPATVTGMVQTANEGGWATNPASGIIEVPSGVSLVEVRAQVAWEAGSGTSAAKLWLRIDGAPVPSGEVHDSLYYPGSFVGTNRIVSWAIPVSGGEQLTLEVAHQELPPSYKNVLSSGQQTWFEVREVAAGGGAAGGGFTADFSLFMPDAPPLSPPSGATFNDEFDGGASLDGRWTWWDPNGDLAASGINAGMQMLEYTLTGGSEWAGAFQSVTAISGVQYSFVTKLSFVGKATAATDEYWSGMAVFEDATSNPATSNLYVAGIYTDTDPAGNLRTRIGIFEFNDYSDATPTLAGYDDVLSDAGLGHVAGLYLRVAWNGTDELRFAYSLDGVSFRQLAEFSASFVPKEVGFAARNVAGGNLTTRAQFFRHWPTSNRDLVLSGAMVDFQRSS